MFFDRKQLVLLLLAALPAAGALSDDPNSRDRAFFRKTVEPILVNKCLKCHDAQRKGELDLRTRAAAMKGGESGAAVTPTKPDESLLYEYVESEEMPPDKPLDKEEVRALRRWIEGGAYYFDEPLASPGASTDPREKYAWWSFRPVGDVAVPQASRSSHPIDRFVDAKLAERGLRRAPVADRRTLIRRLYFDLIGLPPTPERVADFVADDDPLAYERLVDELLASEHFGERWARHWLDIAHYADTHGFERDKIRENAWRYRDYVIRCFNEDKPYDRFLLEQLAGDVVAPEDPRAVIATGFLAAGPWDFVGQVETKSPVLRRAARALDLDDIVTQVMTATMGVTINCARCHDHKLDPISQREYYRLAAVFAGLRRADRTVNATAVAQYDARRKQLAASLRRVSSRIAKLEDRPLDLADIVGGGNGYGTGTKGAGLDARSGKMRTSRFGDLDRVQRGHFATCESAFIDGVFIPTSGTTTISSTSLTASGLPANSGKAWDMIRNGPVNSQFSTEWGGVDYDGSGHSMIGLHANAGITFDLAAMRATRDEKAPMRFAAVVGYGGRLTKPSAEFRVYVDGRLQAHGKLGRNDAVTLDIPLAPSARFLTLISTDGGDGYSHDQISFGDPRLSFGRPVAVTERQRQELEELKQQREALEAELARLKAPPRFYGVVEETPPVIHVLARGNPETPLEAVMPGRPSLGQPGDVFGNNQMPPGQRRLALAEWIVGPSNPLTRRVIVNRLWHWHFGRGLVATPSDFGRGGSPPSHPALLDWLADELLRSGWSLKHIHRLIVTSQTYRMRSCVNDSQQNHGWVRRARELDANNRLLWRMNPRRLEAEAVRDSVLAVSGKLNLAMYGPGYRDFDYTEAYAPVYAYITADSPKLWRRSIYRFIVRTTPSPFMTTLDCADPATLTPKRNVTTTALQSLALFNDEFMLRQARYFAERLAREAGDDAERQIERAFELAFSRPPDEVELRAARQLVKRRGLMHLCRAILNANEFVYID